MKRHMIVSSGILVTGENYYRLYSNYVINITKGQPKLTFNTENFTKNEGNKLSLINFLNWINAKINSLGVNLWKILKKS